MQQSKLIALFRVFSLEDMKAFESFLLSPYFNQSSKLARLFKLIAPHHPTFESDKLTKEKLYKTLHQDKTGYSDATMRELISDLFKLARSYIAHEELKRNTMQAGLLKYQWLYARHLFKLAQAEAEQHRALLEQYPTHDHDYYHHRWQQDIKQFELITEQSLGAEDKLMKEFDLYTGIHSLNREYLVNCLTVHVYLATLAHMNKLKLNKPLVQHLENLAKLYINQGDTVLDLYFNIFKLTQTRDEAYYYELKKRFFEKDTKVPPALMTETGIHLENFCTSKIRQGQEEFSYEVMQIYRFEVENNLLIYNGNLNNILYGNIAARGAETDEIAWTDAFVEQYKNMLPEENREDFYAYSKALVLFGAKKYREALPLAMSCNIPFFWLKVLVRTLLARIQYELNMLDELQVLLHSLKHYLQDDKLNEERKLYLQSYLSILRQLCELKGNFNRHKMKDLANQIELQQGFSKKWFREKVKELESENRRNA